MASWYEPGRRYGQTSDTLRSAAVRTLWACADILGDMRDGLIVLASKVVPR